VAGQSTCCGSGERERSPDAEDLMHLSSVGKSVFMNINIVKSVENVNPAIEDNCTKGVWGDFLLLT